jgi:hypothetical protein
MMVVVCAVPLQIQTVWPEEGTVALVIMQKLWYIVHHFFKPSAGAVTAARVSPTLHLLGPVAFHIWRQGAEDKERQLAWEMLSGWVLRLPGPGDPKVLN